MEYKKIIAAALLGAASLPAAAFADGVWYLGGTLGSSDYGSSVDAAAASLSQALTGIGATNTVGSSKTGTGWSLLAGYQFNEWFGLEGSYFNMGKATVDASETAPVIASEHAEIKLSGESVDGVGTWGFGNGFAVFGKFGLIDAKVDEPVTGGGLAAGRSADVSDTSTAFDWGIGGAYSFGNNWGLRLGWTQYHHVGNANTTGQGNVEYTSLGLTYSFN